MAQRCRTKSAYLSLLREDINADWEQIIGEVNAALDHFNLVTRATVNAYFFALRRLRLVSASPAPRLSVLAVREFGVANGAAVEQDVCYSWNSPS